MTESCALCGSLETPSLHETRFWRTALNRNQNLLGKLIVVLRRHEEQVAALSSEEWGELQDHVVWATERLRAAFSPDHFNYAFLQNQDRHVHLHVIPRYAAPRQLAGLGFSDADYPDHYRVPGPENRVGRDVLEAIHAQLQSPA
jgi:diadenosine tetraphosphate (Ap4A) HIT family hydrolase